MVSNKLGIQADQVKYEKRLANLKPSYSYQCQDGKNRGTEMKKSRSIKLSDIENLRPSTLKQTISQPGKSPPMNVQTTTEATPQKQIPAIATNGSPNYMKSTSSSAARKESLQVSSSRYSQTSSDDKILCQRSSSNSKLSSGSSNKPVRSVPKSSSLKMVRTLTKTPSFKPVRAGAKKCSRVVICADVNAQRATCSSILKDLKFPDYLMLNPGPTDAEGTSAVKVCPYTYCSLNGHHHTPLPPLKCFLSARRRLLKMQRSTKLEALVPRRVTPVNEGAEEIDQVNFDDKPGYKGDLVSSHSSPLIQEVGVNCFIEIYVKNKEYIDNQQIAENLSGGSLCSEIDYENMEQYGDISSREVDITEGLLEEEKVDDPDKGYSTIAAHTDGAPGNYYNGSDFEDESNASSEDNDSISEASDMEWEEGQFPTLEPNTETNDLIKDDKESDLDDGYSSQIVNHDLLGEPTTKSDNIVINYSKNSLVDEIFEESACSETQQSEGDSDSEMNDTELNLEIVVSRQAYENDQESSTVEVETDLIGVMITSSWTEDPIVETTASTVEIEEYGVHKPENETNETGSQFGDVETYYTSEVTDGTLNDEQDISLQDDDLTEWLQNQTSDQVVTDEDYNGSHETEDSKTDQNIVTSGFDLKQEISNNEAVDQIEENEIIIVTKKSVGVQVPDDLFEAYQDDVEVHDYRNQNIIDPCQLEDSAENTNSSQDIVDEILSVPKQEHSCEGECAGINVSENHNNLKKDEVKNFDIPSSMDSEKQSDSWMNKNSLAKSGIREVEKVEVEDSTQSEETETLPMTDCKTTESTSLPLESKSNQEFPSTSSNQKSVVRSKRAINDEDELKNFNPREPNYLPVVPDPDAEKVDLKHQMVDDRKNSEEWMVDYALRQAVTKLAPARKKKVALLVEAFETVIPVPKWETRIGHSSAVFAPTRPIQACS